MFTYRVLLLEQNENKIMEWQDLDNVVRPFYDSAVLDDTLDTGIIKLSMSVRSKAIKPFTRLRIEVYEQGVRVDVINRVVANTKRTRRTYTEEYNMPPLYDWEIETVELTKLLEREVCDSMTVTNVLPHLFGSSQVLVTPAISDSRITPKSGVNIFYTPYRPSTSLTFASANNAFKTNTPESFSRASITVTNPDGEKTVTSGTNTSVTFVAEQVGLYTVEYSFVWDFGIITLTTTATYSFAVVSDITTLEPKTITDVVERLLRAGVTRRHNIESQKYIFPYQQAEKYSTVKSPEFFFTRSTLFEALLQVGNYIHAIPRLVDINNSLCVEFDELGGNTVREVYSDFVFEESTLASEDYCGAIDSNVENLLNTRDKTQGAIVEPSAGTYKTVRCEESKVEISADTMLVLTEFPIYQITKLEIAVPRDYGLAEHDITPYLYEAAEYKTLSSFYGSAYPYAKAFALTYTQGDNKITGLNFKQSEAFDIATAWGNFALRNIIEAVSGVDLSDNPDYINIAFRVTYIPMINTRLVQKKSYADYPISNTLIQNQSANTVESELFGEKMKGIIARLGNEVVRRTYYFLTYSHLPKIGELVDIDGKLMYVAIVDCEYEQRYIKATITYTPNFNKLAENVAIDSNFRLYDISEKQSVDRYVNYGEYIAIASNSFDFGRLESPMLKSMEAFSRVFTQQARQDTVTAVYTRSGSNQGKHIFRPVVSFASGNSLCFAFNYADNFGAGYQSINPYGDKKRVQKLVSYTDEYGEIEYLSMVFTTQLWEADADDQAGSGSAQIYPAVKDNSPGFKDISFDTNAYSAAASGHPLVIQKDSREALSVMVQLHCVALEDDIVIGPALCQNNPLVTKADSAEKAVAYFLPHRINMLNGTIDLTGATQTTYWVTELYGKMFLDVVGKSGEFKSWVIVDPTTNKLLIGRNRDFSGGGDNLSFCSVNPSTMEDYMYDLGRF